MCEPKKAGTSPRRIVLKASELIACIAAFLAVGSCTLLGTWNRLYWGVLFCGIALVAAAVSCITAGWSARPSWPRTVGGLAAGLLVGTGGVYLLIASTRCDEAELRVELIPKLVAGVDVG